MNKDKTVLITGACGGLGSAIATALATAGYSLALHVKKQDERAEVLKKKLSERNIPFRIYSADLRNEDEIASMGNAIRYDFGRLYAVINNAGVAFSGMSWKQSAQDWDDVFAVNIRAPFLVSRMAIPMMRDASDGRIIYISSVVAHRPLAGTSAYAASKAALEGLCRAQAVELSRFGITVNCVAPGYYEAGMIDAVSEHRKDDIRKATLLERLGKPEELAALMVYLCSTEAAFVTGQVHHINGGLYI